jgi:hypothetical protein
MHKKRPVLVILALFVAVFLLVSCQSETSETAAPTTAATAVNPPTVQTEPPLPATATLAPPPVVVVDETATAAPTITPLSPTAVPLPEGLIGPTNFPENVNPLTGETVDPAVLARRPLAIKISNAPAIVRPQSGLNNADLVFEHYAEGGLTRFTAVFYSKDADPVGSIRSGRIIDLEIPKMYDAAFAYSGASGPVRLMFQDSAFFDRIISPDFGHGGFFRVEDPNKAFEHTLFTNTGNLRFILDQRGQNTPPQFQNGMAFSQEPLNPGEPARQIEIGYDGTYVTWAYGEGNGRYTRWTDGQPHLDANTGQQLSFKNIIVLGAHHEDTDILEDNVGGGHYSIQIQIWGEGPVSIFRDGVRIDGRWHRNDPSEMPTFTDLDGNILPLAPGNSFFQLVPLGFGNLIVSP